MWDYISLYALLLCNVNIPIFVNIGIMYKVVKLVGSVGNKEQRGRLKHYLGILEG